MLSRQQSVKKIPMSLGCKGEWSQLEGRAIQRDAALAPGGKPHAAHSAQSNSACISTVFTASSCRSGG